jgi:hypothetical protein
MIHQSRGRMRSPRGQSSVFGNADFHISEHEFASKVGISHGQPICKYFLRAENVN